MCSTDKKLNGDRECLGMGSVNGAGADVCTVSIIRRKTPYWNRVSAKSSVTS